MKNTKNTILGKLYISRRFRRLLILVVIVILAVTAILCYPTIKAYKDRADLVACSVAVKKAQEMLDVEFMGNSDLGYPDALAIVEKSKWGQDALCPLGGDYYLVQRTDGGQGFRVTCGLHEEDTALRTRLNANHMLEMLEQELSSRLSSDPGAPGRNLAFPLNGRQLTAVLLEEKNDIRWGTSTTVGYEDTVCFYTLSPEGELSWFVYADEDHAAIWDPENGWTGDAYADHDPADHTD